MKKILALSMCLLMVLLLGACGSSKGLEVAQGNSNHNAGNAFGAAVYDGENIYYAVDWAGIYRRDPDGNIDQVMESDGYLNSFLLDGDYLYFEEDDAFYRVKKTGGAQELVFTPQKNSEDDLVMLENLVDGKLYYSIAHDTETSIEYCYDLERESNETVEFSLYSAIFTSEGIWALPQEGDTYQLWDGSNRAFPNEELMPWFVSGDYYYGFSWKGDQCYLSRMRQGSTDIEQLLEMDYTMDIDTNGTYIFYKPLMEQTIYRCDMDGKHVAEIYTGMDYDKHFYVLGDHLLIADVDGRSGGLLMDVDGRNQEQLGTQ